MAPAAFHGCRRRLSDGSTMSKVIYVHRLSSLLLLFALFLGPVAALSHAKKGSVDESTSISTAVSLVDHQGENFSLKDLQGRPFILSFVFTGCSNYCPTQIVHLDRVRKELVDSVGSDSFSIVSVSLTPAVNSPADMKQFRDRFSIDASNWLFATGDPDVVAALIDTVGTKVVPTSIPGDVDHTTDVYVIDSTGQLTSRHQGVPLDDYGLKRKVYELASGSTQTGTAENAAR